MPASAWRSGVLAPVMLAVAVYCAGRLLAAARWRRHSELDADSLHLVMGVAMAGALASPVSIAPPGVWELVFAVAAGWFAWQVIRLRRGYGAGPWRCPYPVPHLAESLAMIYMLAPAPGRMSAGAAMPGMGGATTARFPVLAVIFALFMIGYVAWLGDHLMSIRPGMATAAAGTPPAAGVPDDVQSGAAERPGIARQGGDCGRALAPRAALCYKIAMGITMAYMLMIMA